MQQDGYVVIYLSRTWYHDGCKDGVIPLISGMVVKAKLCSITSVTFIVWNRPTLVTEEWVRGRNQIWSCIIHGDFQVECHLSICFNDSGECGQN